ncbi:MAG: LysM peptidoglycan-binding domain-containing protein [Bacteroidota bacterium]
MSEEPNPMEATPPLPSISTVPGLPENTTCGFVHVVRPCENLFTIGERYGVTWQNIAGANPDLRPPYSIIPGQRLMIPVLSYVVQPGDTLFRIGQRYSVNWQAIALANEIKSPFLIYPGQILAVPRLCAYEPPAPAPPQPQPPEPALLPCGLIYLVQKGDNLATVAERFGLPVEALLKANPQLTEPYALALGQRLVVPAKVFLHLVTGGETVYSLAQRYGSTVELVALVNNLRYPFTVYVGQMLALIAPSPDGLASSEH